ncbi:MAG: hypothetical protein RIR12_1136 [Bacteroidota bacterium]|jgi:hypothetical protein
MPPKLGFINQYYLYAVLSNIATKGSEISLPSKIEVHYFLVNTFTQRK